MAIVLEHPRPQGPAADFWRRYRRSALAPIGLLVVVGLALIALFAPLLAPNDPTMTSLASLKPPGTGGHFLGTDDLGRDVLSGVIWGSRVSLIVGITAATTALVIGIIIGAVAGFYGGWIDAALMRITELFQTIPRFVLALLVVALFGRGLGKLVLVIGLLAWPQAARLVRGQFLSQTTAPYVDAARALAMPGWRIIFSEVLPNVLAPVIVLGSLDVAQAILLEASLGFFGLGDPNLVSWGGMLNQAQAYLREAWWLSVFPGMGIALAVIGFNLVGDGLNDVFNPKVE